MFEDNMSVLELENMGIRLVTNSYDEMLHFDSIVSGDKIPNLQNRQFFLNAVFISLEQDFIKNLFCAEVLSPNYLINRCLKPYDLSVKVYGYCLPEHDTVTLFWKWNDIKSDILNFWGSLLMRLKKVGTINEVSNHAVNLWSGIELKEMGSNCTGVWLVIDNKIQTFGIQSMTNVSECITSDDGDMILCFRGQYATIAFHSGEKVTFVIRSSGKGIRRKALYMGIYKDFRYYQEIVAEA